MDATLHLSAVTHCYLTNMCPGRFLKRDEDLSKIYIRYILATESLQIYNLYRISVGSVSVLLLFKL